MVMYVVAGCLVILGLVAGVVRTRDGRAGAPPAAAGVIVLQPPVRARPPTPQEMADFAGGKGWERRREVEIISAPVTPPRPLPRATVAEFGGPADPDNPLGTTGR